MSDKPLRPHGSRPRSDWNPLHWPRLFAREVTQNAKYGRGPLHWLSICVITFTLMLFLVITFLVGRAFASAHGGSGLLLQQAMSFSAAPETPTVAPTATDIPPLPTATPLPQPTVPALPNPTQVVPTATPAPVAFTSLTILRSSNPNTYELAYVITTSPPQPFASVNFSTAFCGAPGGGSSGVLDGSGVLRSDWVFLAPCGGAPFTISVSFSGAATSQTTVDVPAW